MAAIISGSRSKESSAPLMTHLVHSYISCYNLWSEWSMLILLLWMRLSSFAILFPDGNHFIPQVRGWSLLSNTDFSKGSYGHATFLSPTRGGHKTPFIAVLINTSHDASLEISDLPGRGFCLTAYYGQPNACVLCSHWSRFWEVFYIPIKDQYLLPAPSILYQDKSIDYYHMWVMEYRDLVYHYHLWVS